MTDGYAAYSQFSKSEKTVHLACWAHSRRKFDEALRAGAKSGSTLADRAIAEIGKLYAVEKEALGMSSEERQSHRQAYSVPIIEKYFEWIHANRHSVPPKSKLGEAFTYAANHEQLLRKYVEHGDVAIDNNHIESLIRQFVIGRANWLFCDTTDGAHASATIYSLIITAKKNNLDPFDYLRDILNRIPRGEPLEPLLPWNWKSSEN